MVSLEGMITVAEAARRLNRSIEQVRRYLREGKLEGQRIGNQWFVAEDGVVSRRRDDLGELFRRVDGRRETIRRRIGRDVDVVELVRRSREGLR